MNTDEKVLEFYREAESDLHDLCRVARILYRNDIADIETEEFIYLVDCLKTHAFNIDKALNGYDFRQREVKAIGKAA